MKHGSRGAAPLLQFLALHAALGLCPASFAPAKQRLDAEIAAEGRAHVMDSTSLAGPILGVVMFGGFGLFAVVGALVELGMGRRMMWGPLTLGLVFAAIGGLTLRFGLIGTLRTRRRRIQVYASGLDATLTVLSVVRGGKNEADQLKVLVQLPAQPPYEATCQVSLTGSKEERAAAGRSLPAKIDPSDRQGVMPVW